MEGPPTTAPATTAPGAPTANEKFKHAIAHYILTKCTTLTFEQAMQAIEMPKKEGTADYAVCVPKLNQFAKLKGKPVDFAKQWAAEFTPTDLLLKAVCAGPYVNFDINKVELARDILKLVHLKGEKWGCSSEGEGRTVVVEFSSPNIAKPFHYGHLRSTMIGNFLKQVNKAMGYNVIAINYLGDWGKQYGLLAVGFTKYGSEEELKENPIRHLYDVYVKINKDGKDETTGAAVHDEARAYFKRMEQGDQEALALWKKFRDLSIDEYKLLYKRLNVDFDIYSGESMFGEGMIASVKHLEEKGLLTEDAGAYIIDLKAHKLNSTIVKKSDGTTLYITRDIAAATERQKEYNFEKMYYVVGAQQDLHFKQLFKILELMGHDWAKTCEHVNFGMVLGMSTRSGTAVFLSDILEAAQEAMLNKMQDPKNAEKLAQVEDPKKTADILGISALVVQDFNARRIKDYAFDLEKSTAPEGDTGPYMQYAHARLCSMERKTGCRITPDADVSLLVEKEALDLVFKISAFPQAVALAAKTAEPCSLVVYLMDLCHAISSAHRVLWVKDREQNLAEARMLLYWAARVTLGNGLRILGILPLDRM
eukprot:TRINITY_DN3368_c0_g1_i1.p1 TRINITY_DN3368_c0_g1~~TRINITY_DN3368_c0_g1_i1.p1  ORF type:complete len:605 (-),score=98.28 TRINITY_DN3368_c0_g1_i1:154-1929(-)